MKFKKEIIAILLIICVLFTISAISAADSGDEAVSVANDTVEVTGVNVNSENNLQKSNDDVEILGDTDGGSFADLSNKITYAAAGSTVYLENDYEYKSTDTITSGISISKSLTIDGQGHKIDAKGNTRIFNTNMYGSIDVIFKNIVFVNGYASYGGAIYFGLDGGNGEINNCTFINNAAGSYGGSSLYIYAGISQITDCTFINDTVSSGVNSFILSNANVINSIFINNKGTINGIGTIEKCWFGNTEDNIDVLPSISDATLKNYYILKMDLDEGGIATVSLNNLYENGVITTDENYALPQIRLNVKGEGIDVPDSLVLNNGVGTITFTPTDAYSLTVSYNGVEISKGVKPTFSLLQDQINSATTGEISLNLDYEYDSSKDSSWTDGIEITQSLTINGNNHIIDAKGQSNILKFIDDSNSQDLILKDIIFKNAVGTDGAAVYFKGNKIEVINCTFVNNVASGQGDALYITASSNENEITHSTFKDNAGSNSIVYASSNTAGTINNSIFKDNNAANTVVGSSEFIADYNWWGNTFENFDNNIAKVDDATLNNWLFLKIDADAAIRGYATVSLNNVYDGSQTGTFKVTEKSNRTDIDVPDLSDVKVDDKLNISVPDGVDVYVDGVKQTPKDGNVSVPTTAGNHTIVIVANETAENNAVFEVINYTVSKLDVEEFEISAEPAVAGEKFTIAVNITDGATGIVVIDVNGTEYSIDLSKTNSTEVVIGTAGEATIVAKYQGDDKYNAKDSEATTITVAEKAARSDIPSIDFGEVKVGDNLVINVPEDMDIYVDGEKLNRDESGNVALPTDAGTHNVVIVANETATNKAVFEVGDYTVTKYRTNILLGGTPTKVGEKSTIMVRAAKSDATGTVLINVNGTEYSVVLREGVAEIDVVMPVAGDVPVSAIYLGDYKYNVAIHVPINIRVIEKDEAEIEVNNLENVEIGKSHYITIKPEDAEVYIDGVKYAPDAEGDYAIPTTEGVHTISIRTNETKDTKAGYKVINYTVSKKEANIIISVLGDLVVDKTLRINVATYDGADVVVYLDGEKLENYNQIKATAGTHVITASVAESDEYLAAANTTSFSVNKKEAEVYVNTELATAGEPTTISVDIDEDATGIVVINVNGTEYSLNISQSKTLDVVLAESGDYPVTAKYLGDDRYGETLSDAANIHVNDKKEPSIDIEFVTEDFYAGDDVVIAVDVENENSTVLVDGVLYEVVDGKITIKDISAGDHTIEVLSPETAELKPFEYSVTFGVDKRQANVTINIPDEIKVGEPVVIEVSTNSDGKAVVYVDGVEQAPLRGSTTVRFSAGDHIIVATVGETDKYMQASANKTLTVKKLDTTIEVKATDVTEGQSTEITLTTPLEEGIVIVQIGDKQISIDLAKSKTAKVVMETAGKYDVSARFIGSDVYNPAEAKNTTITVSAKVTPEVDVEIPEVKAGESETISVSIPNATGEVHIIIDGEDKVVPLDENGEANYTIDEMPAGEHSIVVVYPGDETHDSIVISKQVNVPKQTSDANITVPSDVKQGEDATVKVDIPGATGSVTLIVDGKEITVPLVNGSAEYKLDNLSAGTHSVVVVYPGDDKTSEVIASSSFDVAPEIIYATEFVDVEIAKDYVVTARLVTEKGLAVSNAEVTFTIGTTTKTVKTGADGSFTFQGENNCVIDVGYAGDVNLLPASTTIILNFTKTRLGTELLAKDLEQFACDYYAGERGGNFTFRLVDSNGKAIANKIVYIGYNGVTYNRTTDENGYAAVQINLKNAGLYTFVIAYLGDDDYNASMAVHKITINKKKTTLSAPAKTFKATAKTKKYTVTLKTNKGSSVDGKTYLQKGKKISLTINGKTYTAKTNAKGQATFSLKITKKGKFATSISFDGDNTYNKVKTSTKITIK